MCHREPQPHRMDDASLVELPCHSCNIRKSATTQSANAMWTESTFLCGVLSSLVVAKDNQPSVCDEFAKGADAQCDGQYLKRCDLFVFPFLEELHHTHRRFHVAIILPAPGTHLLDSRKIIHKQLAHLPSWTKTAAIRGGVLLASA